MIVKEDNTIIITEMIDAYFNVSKHGIIRTIPLTNKVERLDGTQSTNRVKITDIHVDAIVDKSIINNELVLRIGDPKQTITKTKRYTIQYVYDLGKDPSKLYDELYFNLIGSDWDTPIGEVAFTIIMPKPFDARLLGFSYGVNGSTQGDDVHYQVNDTVIMGSLNRILEPNEALTVRLELPNQYFKYTPRGWDFYVVGSIILSLGFVLFAVLLWVKVGNDEKVVDTVEFYPPEGFNSAEVGFLYKGKAESEDVISLLIYLANQGYLRIGEVDEHALFVKSKAFNVYKEREYDGNNEIERVFLDGLFKEIKPPTVTSLSGFFTSLKKEMDPQKVQHEDRVKKREVVNSNDLDKTFYLIINKIIHSLNQKENKHAIFEKSSLNKGNLAVSMIAIIYLVITIRPVLDYNDADTLIFALLFPAIGFSVLFAMVFNQTKFPIKMFGLIWGLGFGGIPWASLVLPVLVINPMYLLMYGIGLISIVMIVLMFKVMPKRTRYGNELLGRIRGFKHFLETAEKSKLEALIFDNPTYFYDILPFTYVLNVSDVWINKFESIALLAPSWYDGSDSFSVQRFGSFINTTMSSAKTVMASSPSSSGSSSGGGSSGGGSGGGGGSSW